MEALTAAGAACNVTQCQERHCESGDGRQWSACLCTKRLKKKLMSRGTLRTPAQSAAAARRWLTLSGSRADALSCDQAMYVCTHTYRPSFSDIVNFKNAWESRTTYRSQWGNPVETNTMSSCTKCKDRPVTQLLDPESRSPGRKNFARAKIDPRRVLLRAQSLLFCIRLDANNCWK
jgi:hypothetical protein